MLQPGTSLFAWLRVLQLGFGVFRHLTRWRSAQDCTLITGDGAAIFRHASELGLEGIVSKRVGSRYVSRRTRAWLKTKNPNSKRR
jgi:ATP-dependent DNA ligase